jgi:hypothetical protein
LVVASIHGRFKLDQKAQTERLLRAVANPYTTILGHMTGRQLMRPPGYDIDVEKVLRACRRMAPSQRFAQPTRLRSARGATLAPTPRPQCDSRVACGEKPVEIGLALSKVCRHLAQNGAIKRGAPSLGGTFGTVVAYA